MGHFLIVIAVAGKPKAYAQLMDRIEIAVEKTTQEGGIDGLTTEVIEGAACEPAREALRDAAAGRARRKGAGDV